MSYSLAELYNTPKHLESIGECTLRDKCTLPENLKIIEVKS